jgi:hypothetical protein
MNGWVQDFRLATRQLRRQFSFGCFAILILAIGIGTNSAMFSVIRTVLFQPAAVLAIRSDCRNNRRGNAHSLRGTKSRSPFVQRCCCLFRHGRGACALGIV